MGQSRIRDSDLLPTQNEEPSDLFIQDCVAKAGDLDLNDPDDQERALKAIEVLRNLSSQESPKTWYVQRYLCGKRPT